MKVKWKCKLCDVLVISNSKEHHKMDFCKCGKCACDLEEYHCRWIFPDSFKNDIEVLEEIKSK